MDKELPENYLKALNIVPNGPFDFRFEVPLRSLITKLSLSRSFLVCITKIYSYKL